MIGHHPHQSQLLSIPRSQFPIWTSLIAKGLGSSQPYDLVPWELRHAAHDLLDENFVPYQTLPPVRQAQVRQLNELENQAQLMEIDVSW